MSENLNEVEKLDVRPFTRFCMSIGAVPSSYLAGLTIEEQLLWLCSYLEKEVIPAVNNNADLLEELKSYVEHYFDNLDVQEEINNKLDAMAESGELEELIAAYINTNALICFDNVSDMKSAENLVDGSYAKTLGFYEANDKGGATYKIRTITNDDVVDEMSIIEMLNDNSLIAELVTSESMNVKQFGIHEDGTTDDTAQLQKTITFCNSKNIELVGNYNALMISASIYIPVYFKIRNIFFKTNSSAGNFTNGFMVGINTTNMNSWTQAYPFITSGYMKNCKFENANNSNLVNGIYNFANNEFDTIQFNNLNIGFKSSSLYLDNVRMKNFDIYQKIGTEYCLQLGYMGDACTLDNAHMHGTLGDKKFMDVGSGHNPISIRNIIANGKINIVDSCVNIDGLHNELATDTQIDISGGQVTIENAYLYHVESADKYNINITGTSSVSLKNVLFCYYLDNYSYVNSSDNDININVPSKLVTENCYKVNTRVGYTDAKVKASIKTNQDTQGSLRLIRQYSNASPINKNNNVDSFNAQTLNATGFQLTGRAKWFLPSGTYYYKVIPMIDNVRVISTPFTATGNLTLTNNSYGASIGTIDRTTWRIYRGTSADNYDSYADVTNVDNSINDNGYFIAGYKWKARTPGDIDAKNTGFLCITQKENGNVECVLSGPMPSVGSWSRGDIIHKIDTTNPGTYVCSVAGTPGTWVKI